MKLMNKIIVPVTASALLLGACGSNATESKDNTLISSKAGDVKVADVMKKMGKEQIANTSFSIVLNKVLADKYKDKVDTKDIDKDIKKEEKQYGGKDQFESMLKQQGMSLDDYKEQKKLSAYQKQLLLDKVQKEVEKNPNKFGEIAKKESMDSSSAKKDGSLGYVIKGQMVDSFEKALFKLKEGEVSKVVKTDYGYHIIKADKETDFNSEKSNIKQKLIEEKVQKKPKLLTDAYKELLKEYKVDYKDRDIKKAIEDSILDPDKIKQQQQQQSQGGSGLTNSGS